MVTSTKKLMILSGISIAIVVTVLGLASISSSSIISASGSKDCPSGWYCPAKGEVALLSDGTIATGPVALGENKKFATNIEVPNSKRFIDFAQNRNTNIEEFEIQLQASPFKSSTGLMCAEGWICLDSGKPLVLSDGSILLESVRDDGTVKVVGTLNGDITDPTFRTWVKVQNEKLRDFQGK